MRGEQYIFHQTIYSIRGSPPLARGTASSRISNAAVRRITPACAGNSCTRLPEPPPWRDHPRLRGEQAHDSQGQGRSRGSPPLARGTEGRTGQQHNRAGITPACAGNSHRRLYNIERRRDHPRLRGEQMVFSGTIGSMVGSPPLARGTDLMDSKVISAIRITPACAGNRN